MSRSAITFAKGCLLLMAGPCLAAASPPVESAPVVDPRVVILSPEPGDGMVDQEIARLQAKIREGHHTDPLIVELGWAFVAKARLTSDPGFYKVAEQCATLAGEDSDSLLLRGHIFHALHRFNEAELVARKVVASDSFARWQTYALLGDALMEQGKLSDALIAYQRMIDIRPCLQTYARVAHFRWLKGDLTGAEELMRMAVSAGNSRDPEPAAWAYSRLAFYQLQGGKSGPASQSLTRAFDFVKNYPAALFLRAKLEVAQSPAKAVESLCTAVAQIPLPEYEWALADAAKLAGNSELAATTERAILNHGAAEDQRSFGLFLADRNLKPDLALELAKNELSNRRDVFTYDALAWAELASGKKQEAGNDIQRALIEGTADARLYYHAGKIALATAHETEAAQWFLRAAVIQQMLLPSERADLRREMASARISLNAQANLSPTNPQLASDGLTREKQ
jgi:tetratricopeptide (TPR) repeat protein